METEPLPAAVELRPIGTNKQLVFLVKEYGAVKITRNIGLVKKCADGSWRKEGNGQAFETSFRAGMAVAMRWLERMK